MSISVLVVLATFIAAAVEWVEALTIVLAVGTVKGWRGAFVGMFAGLVALIALVVIFGVSLTHYIPIASFRTFIGLFLLLFGLKWLYKAILRSSGLKSLHDEAKAFEETRQHLMAEGQRGALALDWVGVGTAFNGVLLEGLEVIFIVLALGGLNSVPAAAAGAIASLAVVAVLGVMFRAPLTRVPENTMKYVVGIMLTAFGTFFVGEGVGVAWWHQDLSLLPLVATYGIASFLLVQVLKDPARIGSGNSTRFTRIASAVWGEIWGLFVDDGALASVAVLTVLGLALYTQHVLHAQLTGLLLVGGILAAVVIALSGALREHGRAVRLEARPAPAAEPVEQPEDRGLIRAL